MRYIQKEAVTKICCGVMNLSPPPKWFYEDLAKVSMTLAAAETTSFNNEGPNVPVAIDGTWQKKGSYFSKWYCYGS
ncbi:hypothetical protein TNCV_3331771 [Trichonephila clavipes]|nr:hypothetical protein TNCV_3331771 [Trichonephila clavipes]